MLVGVLFVGEHDWLASTIGLKVEVEKGVVGGVYDAEDTPISSRFEHLNLSADAVKHGHIDVGDVWGLMNVGHVSSF